MIAYFHKIDPRGALTRWWMTPRSLWNLCCDLRSYDVVYLDEYDPENPRHVVLSWDGPYRNAVEYALPVLKHFGLKSEWFITGDYLGKGNAFDTVEPHAEFADHHDLDAIVAAGGRLQWHTATHADLSQLPYAQLHRELTVPAALRAHDPQGFRWFAHPHGKKFANDASHLVDHGFRGAVLCENGDTGHFSLRRDCALEGMRLPHPTVALIVANFNYARFLAEALDSALAQTQPPDELVVMDDASTDETMQVLERYAGKVTVHRNERNLGIVGNFRRGVDATSADFIAFLGADNRARADYLERCTGALIAHPNAAIAYTDMTIFGPRSEILAGKVGATKVHGDVWHWQFPDFDEGVRASMQSGNVMHGSSAYRRSAYLEVGGYRESGGPEDHDLFRRIVAAGYGAVRVPLPLIEYRQHSPSQANAKHGG